MKKSFINKVSFQSSSLVKKFFYKLNYKIFISELLKLLICKFKIDNIFYYFVKA